MVKEIAGSSIDFMALCQFSDRHVATVYCPPTSDMAWQIIVERTDGFIVTLVRQRDSTCLCGLVIDLPAVAKNLATVWRNAHEATGIAMCALVFAATTTTVFITARKEFLVMMQLLAL